MRLLQVALLLPQHAVDAAAHFPRLLSGFSLLGAQLLLPPPALQLHCRPRARGVPAGASSEQCPRWSRGWYRDWGWDGAGLPLLRARVRGGAGGVLRAAEEQRSQAIAQAHRDKGCGAWAGPPGQTVTPDDAGGCAVLGPRGAGCGAWLWWVWPEDHGPSLPRGAIVLGPPVLGGCSHLRAPRAGRADPDARPWPVRPPYRKCCCAACFRYRKYLLLWQILLP